MKPVFLLACVCSLSTTLVLAQSRVSIAPTYWFNYNPYSYQFAIAGIASTTRNQIDQHNLVSSFGLSAHYHPTPQWGVSTGLLYYKNTAYIDVLPNTVVPFTSEGWQLPLLVNYRLTEHRISPYFSTGALFSKSKTFTDASVRTEAVVGVGVAYRFASNLSLFIQPTASYSSGRPASTDVFQYSHYRSYSLGVQTQVIWHFQSH